MIERNAGDALTKTWIDSITSYNEANLEKLKSNPKNKVVFPSQAELDEAQKLLAPVREEWVAASERHKELKAALDAELAAVREGEQGLTAQCRSLQRLTRHGQLCLPNTRRHVLRHAGVFRA